MPIKAPGTKQTDKAAKCAAAKRVGQEPVAQVQQADLGTLQRAVADPRVASPSHILALQRAVGNRATTHLIQTKLTVAPAGDRYEREADRVAEQVVSGQPKAVESVQNRAWLARAVTAPVTIQRKLEMDRSWAYMLGMGWAEGAQEIWNYIEPRFGALDGLLSKLGELRGKPAYREEDISSLEGQIRSLQQKYDRKISLTEGKDLEEALKKLPLPKELAKLLAEQKRKADEVAKQAQQESAIKNLVGELSDFGAQPINSGAETDLVQKRKGLKKELDTYLALKTKPLLTDEKMDSYTKSVTSLREKWEAAHQRLLEEQAKKRKAEQEAALAKEREDKLNSKNKQRLGKFYSNFTGYATPEQLDKILDKTSDYAELVKCKGNAAPDKLPLLLDKTSAPHLAKLLQAIGPDKEDELLGLLENIKKGDEAQLVELIKKTEDDRTVLTQLLIKVGKKANVALELVTLGGAKKEKSVLNLLNRGVAAADAIKLLNTTSGKGNVEDIETLVVYGGLDVKKAVALLNTPGLKGSASEVIDLLAHPDINQDITKATPLLSQKGSGADVMSLLQVKRIQIKPDDAQNIMTADKFVRDQGQAAAKILESADATVADTIWLLGLRTPQEIYSYIDPTKGAHKFSRVLFWLRLHNDQTFWTDETCPVPAPTEPGKSINDIIQTATYPPLVGRYSGGNSFGNYGGVDNYGKLNMLLPGDASQNEVNYREYDLRPFTTPAERGVRRFVVGGGKKFYSADHYETFAKFA